MYYKKLTPIQEKDGRPLSVMNVVKIAWLWKINESPVAKEWGLSLV